MNTEFYRQMLSVMMKHEWSISEFARQCDVCRGTFIEFFNVNQPFRPLQIKTMAKINNRVGISYDVMNEYNRIVKQERGE